MGLKKCIKFIDSISGTSLELCIFLSVIFTHLMAILLVVTSYNPVGRYWLFLRFSFFVLGFFYYVICAYLCIFTHTQHFFYLYYKYEWFNKSAIACLLHFFIIAPFHSGFLIFLFIHNKEYKNFKSLKIKDILNSLLMWVCFLVLGISLVHFKIFQTFKEVYKNWFSKEFLKYFCEKYNKSMSVKAWGRFETAQKYFKVNSEGKVSFFPRHHSTCKKRYKK